MLSCTRVLEALGDLLDDPEALRLHRDLARHIEACASCQAIYDTSKETLRIVTESRTIELPAPLADQVVSRVMDAVRGSKPDR